MKTTPHLVLLFFSQCFFAQYSNINTQSNLKQFSKTENTHESFDNHLASHQKLNHYYYAYNNYTNTNPHNTSYNGLLKEIEYEININANSSLLKVKSPLRIDELQILSIDGEILKSKIYSDYIDISRLSPGMYLVKVFADDRIGIKKIIKI